MADILPVESTADAKPQVAEEEVQQQVAEEPTYSELEQLALEMGWNPNKDDVANEGNDFVDAKTFIKRTRDIQSSQSRTIREQNRKLDRVLGSVEQLKAHYAKVAEAQAREYEDKIEALKRERREAIAENDPDRVDAIDTKIDKVKVAAARAATEVPQPPRTDPLFDEWRAANPIYDSDPQIKAACHLEARKIGLQDIEDDVEYQLALEDIMATVKAKFPNKFQSAPARPKAPAGSVEGVRPGAGRGTKSWTRQNLPEHMRSVYDNFVDMGLDGKQIIADWVKTGELA